MKILQSTGAGYILLLVGTWLLQPQSCLAETVSLNNLSSERLIGGANAKNFGAVGDGVADDTAALQATVDFAQKTKTKVYIPGGTYLLTGTLNIPEAIEVCGDG